MRHLWIKYRIAQKVAALERFTKLALLGAGVAALAYISEDTRVMAREMMIANNMRAATLEQELSFEKLSVEHAAIRCQMDLLTTASRMGWGQAYRFVRDGFLEEECS
jgi:hypothetical protein